VDATDVLNPEKGIHQSHHTSGNQAHRPARQALEMPPLMHDSSLASWQCGELACGPWLVVEGFGKRLTLANVDSCLA
jgi:hypothetical protein